MEIKKDDKPKMNIDTFNKLNTSITEMLVELTPYITDVSIVTARKNLMEAGKSIGESFYRYEQKKEEEK